MEEWTVKERYKLNEGTLVEIRLICFTTVLSYLQSAKQGLQEDCLDVKCLMLNACNSFSFL